MSKVKTALITGGTGGIGTALCQAYYEVDYKLIITHNSKSEEFLEKWLNDNRFSTERVTFLDIELRNGDNVHKIISDVTSKISIDVLINNAGITADSKFEKMSANQWEDVIDVNLKALFYVTQPVVKSMLKKGSGCIINISSVNGQKGQIGQTNYSASKAGIIGFTKALAAETAKYGIRVNAIAPGYSNTNMVQSIRPDILEKIIYSIPNRQLVPVEEIASSAIFLSEHGTSVTGETISINGGLYMS